MFRVVFHIVITLLVMAIVVGCATVGAAAGSAIPMVASHLSSAMI